MAGSWKKVGNIKGPQGVRGERGPQGIPSPLAVQNDATVAGLVDTTGTSLTQQALDARYPHCIIVAGPGIDPTGVTDSSAAFQALLYEAQVNNGTLVIPKGVFRIHGIKTFQLYQMPTIVGAGMHLTTLRGNSAGSILEIQGLPALVAGGSISNLTIENPGGTCLELAGPVGFTMNQVRFNDAKLGLLFHNRDAGSYTEFCVADSCYFEEGLDVAIEYKVTAGDPSFHGSGFRGCVINQRAGATKNSIIIRTGCTVYNAPWDGIWFGRVAGLGMVLNESSQPARVFGHLSFESFGDDFLIVQPSSIGNVIYAGTMARAGSAAHRGDKFILATDFSYNNDGSASFHPAFRQAQYAAASGATPTLEVFAGGLFTVKVQGSNYCYQHLVYASSYATDPLNGFTTIIATGEASNGAGYGPPTYTVANGRLVINHASFPASGITVNVGATAVTGSSTNPLL